MLKIYCKNNGQTKEFQEGTCLLDMIPAFGLENSGDIIAAIVNNVSEGLKFRAFNNRDVEFLDYNSFIGRGVYCRSLCFVLCKAAKDVFPECKIILRRPISKGYYCCITKGDGTELEMADIERIKLRMTELISANIPFRRIEERAPEAVEVFRKLGDEDKVKLIVTSDDIYVTYYTLEDTPDYYYDALLPSTGYLKSWDLIPYRGNMLLRVPDHHNPGSLAAFSDQPKTFEVMAETQKWNQIMGLENVGDVNCACCKGAASDLIQISEALQEKKIVKIAEEIERRYYSKDAIRLVLITGPTSSGKSTFCKRLSVQLMACGLRPISFSTDDYFVNREDTPRLPDGSYDFDNFETVDHEYLQKDLIKLLAGEKVVVPEFNFAKGQREYKGKQLFLDKDAVLLVEGIHALNPRLSDKVPESSKFKIFINTITSLSLDDHNCISTSDIRLIRRILRDYKNRGFTARDTISGWPNVRRSEAKWILPFQETADVLFNSSYLVEFAVLRRHAERVLSMVPRNCREYSEAYRLMNILHYFNPVDDRELPATSLIRSFID